MTKSTLANLLAFAALYLLWGSTYMAIAVALQHGIPPLIGAGWRMLVAGLLLFAWFLLKRGSLPKGRQLFDLAIAGNFLFLGGNGMVMIAEQKLSSGTIAVVCATMPLWMALIEAVLPRGERLSRLGVGGIVIGFAGVVVLLADHLSDSARFADIAIALASPALWAVGGSWTRHRLHGVGAVATSSFEMLFGSLGLFLAGWLSHENFQFAGDQPGYLALAYLIVAGSLLGFGSFTFLLQRLPAAKVATYAYVNPVVAVILGALFIGEAVTPRLVIGTSIILVGVLFVNLAKIGLAKSAVANPSEVASNTEPAEVIELG